jgi:hypothetical protein
MKPRPILPRTESGMAMTLPVRVELAPREHITWYADGWIRKAFPDGNVEEWAPLMMVSVPYMHQTVMPSGTLHTTYHTTDDAPEVTIGTFINYHMVDVNDVDVMHWDNDCNCFEEEDHDADVARIYPSRCAAIGRHVGDGDCAVCAPELSDNENGDGRYVAEEEDYDY